MAKALKKTSDANFRYFLKDMFRWEPLKRLKQLGLLLGPLIFSTFLSGIEDKCLKKKSKDSELCIIGINNHNSTGYFEMIFSGVLFLSALCFAQTHETKETELKTEETSISEMKLRQVKPFEVINEISVVCWFSTMTLYLLQSSTEAILPQFTKYFLGFGPVENSFVYAIAGGSSIFGFVGRY